MLNRILITAMGLVLVLLALGMPVQAGPTIYQKGDSWADLGILVQVQYKYEDPDEGPSTDELFFRRLRPTIEGGLDKDWQGILQLDFGAGAGGTDYEVTVRWVNFQYMGFADYSHLTVGSFKHFYSREFLTLGPHLQSIERTYVGDNDYGNPAYTIGIGWDQILANRKGFYAASFGAQNHQQDVTKMSFKSPANATSDSNQGFAAAARFDWHVLGLAPLQVKPLQGEVTALNRGDFHTKEWSLMLSAGGYYWWNDDDNNPFTVDGTSTSTTEADLDKAYGLELSGGIRGFGLSADAEYQYVKGELIDNDFTGGLYKKGNTALNKLSLSAGYMAFLNQVELVGGWSYLDADNYDRASNIYIAGLNWFVKGYTVRFSTTYRYITNVDGVSGNDDHVFRLQGQLAW